MTFQFFHRVRDVVPAVRREGRKSLIDRIELEPQLPDGVEGRLFERDRTARVSTGGMSRA